MYNVPGLTSPKVQKFINILCNHAETYLEVGSFLGATAVAALDGNKLDAYFVDTWKEPVKPLREDIDMPINSKDVFIQNVRQYKGFNNIRVFECDMFDVDLSEIKPIDVFFYDADHDKDITSRAIQYYSTTFSDTAVMLIDDANFDGVVEGAREGIIKSGFRIDYDRLLLNDLEDADAWWNGLYIAVITK